MSAQLLIPITFLFLRGKIRNEFWIQHTSQQSLIAMRPCVSSTAPESLVALKCGNSEMEGQPTVQQPSFEVTGLLRAWSGGDENALAAIIKLVYPELRAIARRCLSGERASLTIQATALVHEAYLRLVD